MRTFITALTAVLLLSVNVAMADDRWTLLYEDADRKFYLDTNTLKSDEERVLVWTKLYFNQAVTVEHENNDGAASQIYNEIVMQVEYDCSASSERWVKLRTYLDGSLLASQDYENRHWENHPPGSNGELILLKVCESAKADGSQPPQGSQVEAF